MTAPQHRGHSASSASTGFLLDSSDYRPSKMTFDEKDDATEPGELSAQIERTLSAHGTSCEQLSAHTF